MTWLQILRAPIMLKDGRRLARLTDVHEFISELPADRADAPHWRLTVTLLEAAAKDSTHAALRSLHEQLCRALAFDQMI
jgi:hypothetical protein